MHLSLLDMSRVVDDSVVRVMSEFVVVFFASSSFFCFFFKDTATTEIYTLSLHDALPICRNEKWAV